MSGYIKLHRALLNWEWYSDHNAARLFMHVLMTVNYKPSRWCGHDIPEGARIAGREALSSEIGLSVQQVRTALKKLQSTGEVTIRAKSKFSIISIVNWKKYQGFESDQPTDNQQVTNNQPTDNQQVTTSKQGNNITREQKNPPKSPQGAKQDSDFEEFWNAYPQRNIPKPKKPARDKWEQKIKAGFCAKDIISGAYAYANDMRKTQKAGTEFVLLPASWLNQEQWADYADRGGNGAIIPAGFFGPTPEEIELREKKLLASRPRRADQPTKETIQ